MALGIEDFANAKVRRLKICHVSSSLGDILPRANEGQAQYGGFLLALKQFRHLHPNLPVDWKVFKAQGALPSDGVAWADKKKCHVIVGLVSSRDALIAAPFLKKHKIFGFSSMASTDLIKKGFPYIRSAAIPSSLAMKFLAHQARQKKFSHIYVIYEADDIFSLSYLDSLRPLIKVKPIALNRSRLIPIHQLESLRSEKRIFLLYTTYPLRSGPSLIQLAKQLSPDQQRSLVMYGNSSWMETQILHQLADVLRLFPHRYIMTAWHSSKNKDKFDEFSEAYRLLYGKRPDHDSSYDFDVTQQILTCYESSSKAKSLRRALQACLSKPSVLHGVTGDYSFPEGKAHAQRRIRNIAIDQHWLGGGGKI